MQSRDPSRRKAGRPPCLLSTRSALILALATLAALGGAGLLHLAHRPLALTVLGAVATFAGAVKLLDSMIGELCRATPYALPPRPRSASGSTYTPRPTRPRTWPSSLAPLNAERGRAVT
jgi:hypothetical protein